MGDKEFVNNPSKPEAKDYLKVTDEILLGRLNNGNNFRDAAQFEGEKAFIELVLQVRAGKRAQSLTIATWCLVVVTAVLNIVTWCTATIGRP